VIKALRYLFVGGLMGALLVMFLRPAQRPSRKREELEPQDFDGLFNDSNKERFSERAEDIIYRVTDTDLTEKEAWVVRDVFLALFNHLKDFDATFERRRQNRTRLWEKEILDDDDEPEDDDVD
jgi:hypothetical protein